MKSKNYKKIMINDCKKSFFYMRIVMKITQKVKHKKEKKRGEKRKKNGGKKEKALYSQPFK